MRIQLKPSKTLPRCRIFISGKKLRAHAVRHGDRFDFSIIDRGLAVLTRSPTGTTRINGSPAYPSLDLTGKAIARTFLTDYVNVEFAPNQITITEARE